MKRFYSKFRIALMTFALGLASVWLFNGLGLDEVSVKLPQAQSDSVIFVFPKERKNIRRLGENASSCGGKIDKPIKTTSKIEMKRGYFIR